MDLWLRDCLTLKNASRNSEVSLKKPKFFLLGRTLAKSGAKVQSRFYSGDLVTRTGDRDIRSVSGSLPDYPGELACMNY